MQQTQTPRELSACATRRNAVPMSDTGCNDIENDCAPERTRELSLLNAYRWLMAYLIISLSSFHTKQSDVPSRWPNVTDQHENVTHEYVTPRFAIISHCGPSEVVSS